MSFGIKAEAFAKPFGSRFNLRVLVKEYKSCGVFSALGRGGTVGIAMKTERVTFSFSDVWEEGGGDPLLKGFFVVFFGVGEVERNAVLEEV